MCINIVAAFKIIHSPNDQRSTPLSTSATAGAAVSRTASPTSSTAAEDGESDSEASPALNWVLSSDNKMVTPLHLGKSWEIQDEIEGEGHFEGRKKKQMWGGNSAPHFYVGLTS